MRSVIPFLPLAPVLLACAACDRQSSPAPQANAANEAAPAAGGAVQEESFTGKLDIAQRGSPAPTDGFTAPDGRTVTLASFKGTPVLVNLWATWCGPCVKEMPTLDALAGRSQGKLKVLTVAQDLKGAEVVGPWFAARDFKRLEPYLDPENKLGLNYGSGMLPTTILYDAEGKEVWRVVGGMDWDGPRANTLLAETLN